MNGGPDFEYRFLGDRNTDPFLKEQCCRAIRRADGKCIRARNGSMLVAFENNLIHVVPARMLRKITK